MDVSVPIPWVAVTSMGEERQRNPDDEHLPGSVSNQNAEEQPPAHEGQQHSRRPPGRAGGGDDDSRGEAGEGSQSTGSPTGAG